VCFSNGGPIRGSDRRPDVRGLAVKVLGVPGKKLIPGLEAAPTQDFLAIHSPVTPFRNADEFVKAIQRRAQHCAGAAALFRHLRDRPLAHDPEEVRRWRAHLTSDPAGPYIRQRIYGDG